MSEQEKHYTPGPWKYSITWSHEDDRVVRHASIGKVCRWGGFTIATISPEVTNDSRLGNARIMAASPDMLEALEWVAELPYGGGKKIGDIDPVKSAIAKAYGE